MLKRFVLFYLCFINVINYGLAFFIGTGTAVRDSLIHPGVIIGGIITILLIWDYITHKKRGSIYYILAASTLLFLLLLYYPTQSYLRFSNQGLLYEINSSFKIILFILIINYVSKRHQYFLSKLDTILIINICTVIVNLNLAYWLGIGQKTMYPKAQFYKGFLAGNTQSIFSFIFFAYLLYNLTKNIYMKILFILNLSCFYILGTKGFYFTGLILIIFLLDRLKKHKIKVLTLSSIAVVTIIIIINTSFHKQIIDVYNTRIGYHFHHTRERLLSKGKKYYDNISLSLVEDITGGGRLYTALDRLDYMANNDFFYVLFGQGAAGQKVIYDSPSKMDTIDILFKYGLIGFFCIYGIIWIILKKIIILRQTDCISTIIICIFIYSSLGGFTMGTTAVGSLYAFFLGLRYGNKNKKDL